MVVKTSYHGVIIVDATHRQFVPIKKLVESPHDWNKQATLLQIRRRKEKRMGSLHRKDLEKISRRTGVIVSAHSLGHPVFLETSY